MYSDSNSSSISEFTNCIETVFRKLIRFLVGRVSLAKLQEMIRHIYVQEAENSLKDSRPGKYVSLSGLALFTGIDTRTVTQIRKNIHQHKDRYTQLPLKELTPESAVVESWAREVKENPDDLKKQILSYDGPDSGFERLFRRTIPSSGVTSQSLIDRLVATNSVVVDKKNKTLKLVVSEFSPFLADDESNAVISALSAISNLVSTIDQNVRADPLDRIFQRQTWTFRLNPADQLAFRETMKSFLEKVDVEAKSKIESWEQPEFDDDQMTAGVGYYFFEEPNSQ